MWFSSCKLENELTLIIVNVAATVANVLGYGSLYVIHTDCILEQSDHVFG